MNILLYISSIFRKHLNVCVILYISFCPDPKCEAKFKAVI